MSALTQSTVKSAVDWLHLPLMRFKISEKFESFILLVFDLGSSTNFIRKNYASKCCQIVKNLLQNYFCKCLVMQQ